MVTEIEQPGHRKVKLAGFPLKMRNNPCRISLQAPKPGEHTGEILAGIGIDESKQEKLRSKGII